MNEIQKMGNDELQDFIDAAALIFDFGKVEEQQQKLNKPARAALERLDNKSKNLPKQAELLYMLKDKGVVTKFG
jgi:hypothetical protein